MKLKKIFLLIFIIGVLSVCVFLFFPRRHVLDIFEEKPNLIMLYSPEQNEIITSPLLITGKARGNWFFEASFPIVLVDWDGRIIATAIAEAQSDWMTEDFVEFKAELNFNNPDISVSNRGALILKKDNPSGLPENDDALEIPIKFADQQNGVLSKLQGKWMSADDKDSVVEFINNKKIDFYAGQWMSENDFILSQNKYIIIGDGKDKLKYEIVDITQDFLTLVYIGRGNVLKYTR
ncbi:MAG: Gmad2 immunoglobulin-like domain-containing protein [Patescibacteria group bacterium]